ncbi:YfiR family protein [Sphingomonas sp. SRS2]|uniref:YfiR family protein n=1 Tax=Sphingomonas sp. SRS2 TaxID=133190 RepID=UPI001F459DDA|nr:YfiR family protein [Sphingomonas sp. SRS2]
MALAVPAAAPAPLEQAIKASYITKFAPFVEWPAAAFASPASPFTICVAGRDAFGPVLEEVARAQKVRGRPMQIRRIGESPPAGGCHILLVGAGPSDTMLNHVAGQPVLTITDKSAGIDGGMIRFVRQAGRVRFEIDNGAARAAHLSISSKLLGLAVTVAR